MKLLSPKKLSYRSIYKNHYRDEIASLDIVTDLPNNNNDNKSNSNINIKNYHHKHSRLSSSSNINDSMSLQSLHHHIKGPSCLSNINNDSKSIITTTKVITKNQSLFQWKSLSFRNRNGNKDKKQMMILDDDTTSTTMLIQRKENLTNNTKTTTIKKNRKNVQQIQRNIVPTIPHPQEYLDKLLSTRGYPIEQYQNLGSVSTYEKATLFQKACYGKCIKNMLKNTNNINELREMYEIGLYPNSYDSSIGEYFIYQVCQNYRYDILQLMIEYSCNEIVQTSDMYGRTPLHALCMSHPVISKTSISKPTISKTTKATQRNHKIKRTLSSSTDITVSSSSSTTTSASLPLDDNMILTMILLLQCDPFLFYKTDCRNATPLSYIPQQFHAQYIELIDQYCDQLWPQISSSTINMPTPQINNDIPSNNKQSQSKAKKRLTLELASLLSSGNMDADEIQILYYEGCNDESNDIDNENDDDDIINTKKTVADTITPPPPSKKTDLNTDNKNHTNNTRTSSVKSTNIDLHHHDKNDKKYNIITKSMIVESTLESILDPLLALDIHNICPDDDDDDDDDINDDGDEDDCDYDYDDNHSEYSFDQNEMEEILRSL